MEAGVIPPCHHAEIFRKTKFDPGLPSRWQPTSVVQRAGGTDSVRQQAGGTRDDTSVGSMQIAEFRFSHFVGDCRLLLVVRVGIRRRC